MSDEEFEEEIDKMYDEMFQKQSEMEELGLINYGDMSYYLQHPEEYENDRKICELESEVIRLEHKLKISEKALELLKYQPNYYRFVNENTETIDVDLAISKAKEMMKSE